uniref:F-box domain-containing protein n=1 Tax=Steinernema glaseri TaxID=37863 RepID=A0A1I7YJ76_9BILA
MDELPYDFLDQLCSISSSKQLHAFSALSSQKWIALANSHLHKRRHFDVRITIDDRNGNSSVNELRQVPGGRRSSLKPIHCANIDRLKSMDQRHVRFRKVEISFSSCGQARTSTDFGNVIYYVTALLDSNSCLAVRSSGDTQNVPEQLLTCLKGEKFHKFVGLELCNEGGELCQIILEDQVASSSDLKEIALTGRDDCWNGVRMKECIKKYVHRNGSKTLRVGNDFVLEPMSRYLDAWLRDPRFELTLYIGYVVEQIISLSGFLHYFGQEEDGSEWYGRVHPTNKDSCALANMGYEEDMKWFWICFTANRNTLPNVKKSILNKECKNKGQCSACKSE